MTIAKPKIVHPCDIYCSGGLLPRGAIAHAQCIVSRKRNIEMTISEIVLNVRTMGINDKKKDLEKKEKYVDGMTNDKTGRIC